MRSTRPARPAVRGAFVLALLALAPAPADAQPASAKPASASAPAAPRHAPPSFLRLSGTPDSAAARHLIGLTHRWHQALVDADSATMGRILADDFALIVAPDPEDSYTPRANYVANSLRVYRITSFSFPSVDVHIAGDVAVLTWHYIQSAVVAGAPRDGRFFLTDVWRRRGGEWRVLSRSSTWLDQPAARPLPPAREVSLTAAERARYVGSYDMGTRTVRVVERNDSLRIITQPNDTTGRYLMPIGNHEFAFPARSDLRHHFTLQGDRAVSFVLTDAGRLLARAVRVP